MNKDLYESIKNELNSLEEGLATPSYVGGHLLGQKLRNRNSKDFFTVVYAFYEYMSEREEFSFIKEGGWANFYCKNLSDYLTKDNIKANFDDIIADEKLLDTILKVCNDEVKKDLYDQVTKKQALYVKTGSNKYSKVYKKIKDVIEKDNVHVIASGTETSSSIDEELENLRKRQASLESQKVERRNNMFAEASRNTGIKGERLIKEVDKKMGKGASYNVDSIVLDDRLVSKLAANSALAATAPNSILHRIKENINSFRFFKGVNLEVTEIDENKVIKITKKDTVFDKLARTNNALVMAISKAAKEKLELFKALVKPSKEVKDAIKQVLIDTNEKFTKQFSKAKEYVASKVDNAEQYVSSKLDNAQQYVASKVDNAKQKAADKLYKMADRLSPVEYEEYFKEQQKGIILRSGTKFGELNNPIEIENSSKSM